ncbi:MAG: glycosyltransferase family 2 protein [Acidimicrobiales bacterium]
MSLAVVICTRDRPAMLAGALDALATGSRQPDQLVVVDSASVDPIALDAARQHGATIVRCDQPGLGRARNLGIAALDPTVEMVAFTDDDCLADDGWLAGIEAAFAGPSAPDFVTGRVHADRTERRRASLGVSLMVDPEPRALLPTGDVRTFGHGANMAFRRSALDRIGGFDDLMGVGSPLRAGEDVDAFWRVLDTGGTGWYTPDAVIVHRQWRSRREMLRSYHGYGVGAGAVAWKRRRAGRLSTGEFARLLLVDEGVAPLWRSLRRGYQMAAIGDAMMFAGGLRGALSAGRLSVVEGRFALRRP